MNEKRPRSAASVARRIIVGVIIASFGLAALGGIVVLLGGDIDDTGWRVLSTTALIGAFSVAVLCCTSLLGRRLQVFGFAGAAVAVATAGLSIFLVWWNGSSLPDGLYETLWTGLAATIATAFASLLLLLADREQTAVRVGLVVTLGLFAIVFAMTVYLIWWSETVEDDLYGRVLGIVGILAALGAIVVPVLSLLLRRKPATALSPQSIALLEAEAARRGTTPDALLGMLLDEPQ